MAFGRNPVSSGAHCAVPKGEPSNGLASGKVIGVWGDLARYHILEPANQRELMKFFPARFEMWLLKVREMCLLAVKAFAHKNCQRVLSCAHHFEKTAFRFTSTGSQVGADNFVKCCLRPFAQRQPTNNIFVLLTWLCH